MDIEFGDLSADITHVREILADFECDALENR